MRRAAKIDANQTAVVQALRSVGATVEILSAVGKGCPDLLVGFRGVNYLLEVKDGDKVASAQKLTKDQKQWHAGWRGQKAIVRDPRQAVGLLVGEGILRDIKEAAGL